MDNLLKDEEKIANAVADSVSPLLIPNFQFHTSRKRDLLIITVPHSFSHYYLRSKGLEEGVYIRFGSTNRLADSQTIAEIQRLKEHKHFDELPNLSCPIKGVALDEAKILFSNVSKKFTEQTAKSLDLLVTHQGKAFPSNGAVLLFGKELHQFCPDAFIKMGRFEGTTKTKIIDQKELISPLAFVLNDILAFIKRHTSISARFKLR